MQINNLIAIFIGTWASYSFCCAIQAPLIWLDGLEQMALQKKRMPTYLMLRVGLLLINVIGIIGIAVCVGLLRLLTGRIKSAG
jgi:hypothetical protein